MFLADSDPELSYRSCENGICILSCYQPFLTPPDYFVLDFLPQQPGFFGLISGFVSPVFFAIKIFYGNSFCHSVSGRAIPVIADEFTEKTIRKVTTATPD
jgi:hypothetical protein